jgi:hypothetical protein
MPRSRDYENYRGTRAISFPAKPHEGMIRDTSDPNRLPHSIQQSARERLVVELEIMLAPLRRAASRSSRGVIS